MSHLRGCKSSHAAAIRLLTVSLMDASLKDWHRAISWYFRTEERVSTLFRIIDVPINSWKRRRREHNRFQRIEEQIRLTGDLGMFLEDRFEMRQCIPSEFTDWILETWPCEAIRDPRIGHRIAEQYAFAGREHGGGGKIMPEWQRFFGILESHFSQCPECAERVWSNARQIRQSWKADKPRRRALIEGVHRDFAAVFK
jgi:hypothetical protein